MDDHIPQPTYPTNSLNFLKRLRSQPNDPSLNAFPPHPPLHIPAVNGTDSSALPVPLPLPPPLHLQILIIGAGLGGLATAIALSRQGHTVTILESAPALGEVGAGIQIPPNSMRILLNWGLGEHLAGNVVEPSGMTFRRWRDGRPIAYTRLIPDHRDRFAAPYYVVHRAHFHAAMAALARERGVHIRLACHVVAYEEEGDLPAVRLAEPAGGGARLTADLIVAADGVKSAARRHIPGLEAIAPRTTGFAAWRATVDVAALRAEPATAWLVRPGAPALDLWVGDGRHVMTYTIAGGASFNMVLSHRDATDPGTWSTDPEECLAQMRDCYADWDPTLVKITRMIEKTAKWPLVTVPTSPRWLSESKRLLILGDAAHGMLPYMSQGAAMAVEDGAALAEALSFVSDKAQLTSALEMWQRVRVQRSSQMQQASAINGMIWHFADGPEQQARDESMQAEVKGEEITESANQWSDPRTAEWAYGYDACDEIRKEMKKRE